MPSVIRGSDNFDSLLSVSNPKAWVNFDGTRDSTGAVSTANTARFIRGSSNVSSVMRNGIGDYTVNFINVMPNINYITLPTVANWSGVATVVSSREVINGQTVSSTRISATYLNSGGGVGGGFEPEYVAVAVFN